MSDDRERIEALLRIIDEHELDALTLRFGETSYEVVRREPRALAAQPPAPGEATTPIEQKPASGPSSAQPTTAVSGAAYRKVTAPIIGVFYRASSPGSDPFVNIGDRVEAGQTVCIIEAMKLMNEITTEHAGVVRRVLPENGALVSLSEELLWIEP